ncbi:MAG TPA: VOC family protein [Lacunisphaera sp.]|nr:VOC family protein [Lacunisphaera sp.]
MIQRLGHLCFRTHQLPAMVAFYRDVLGLTVKFGLQHDDGTTFGYYLAAGHTTFIEIFDHAGAARQWGGPAGSLGPNEGVHYHHFCLEVKGLEDFLKQIEARGGKIDRPVKVGMDHSKQAWLKDPDGNAIELMEYTAKSLQL